GPGHDPRLSQRRRPTGVIRNLVRPTARLCLQTPLHVGVSRFDELSQSLGMDFPVRPELHVTHGLARALEKPSGIGDLRAAEETDVDVIWEGIEVTESRIADARGRMAVMQQLPDVVSAVAHDLEPAPRDRSQFPGMFPHPDVDRRISLYRRRKPQKPAHEAKS